MIKIILKDLLSTKRAVFTIILMIGAYYFSCNFTIRLNGIPTLISTFLITFLSTMQIYFSYFIKERVISYYQLPIKITKFYITFLLSIFLMNFIERILIIGILMFRQFATHMDFFMYCIIYSFYVLIVSFFILDNLENSEHWIIKSLKIFMYLIISAVPIVLYNQSLLWILLFMVLIKLLSIENLIYFTERERQRIIILKDNYFVTSLIEEKAFFMNVIFEIIFVIYLSLQNRDVHILLPMVFTIVSINSPIATLISAERDLLQQIKLLPNSDVIYKMYAKLLFLYFTLINTLVYLFLLYIHALSITLLTIICLLFLIVFEVYFSALLEKYWIIKNWHLKKDIWKNPRKYILAGIVYFVTFSASFLF